MKILFTTNLNSFTVYLQLFHITCVETSFISPYNAVMKGAIKR